MLVSFLNGNRMPPLKNLMYGDQGFEGIGLNRLDFLEIPCIDDVISHAFAFLSRFFNMLVAWQLP